VRSVDEAISFAELNAGVQKAEDLLALRRYREALTVYVELLRRRLDAVAGGDGGFDEADLIVVERLAELATLFGFFDAADSLLEGMVTLCREAGNDLGADYAHMKRVELVLSRGQTHDAFVRLGELKHRIGEPEQIDLSPTGLIAWERSIRWPPSYGAADRAVLLTRIYYAMGRILAAIGRYGDALCVLQRGLVHADDAHGPDLARRAATPMRLARAAALLERGELDEAEELVVELATHPDDHLAPAIRTRRLELAGKLHMMRGRLAAATEHFGEVMQFCQQHGFVRARAAAALNLAHVFVLLNRVGEALRLVQEAADSAAALADHSLDLRAAAIGSLALARRYSPVAAVSIALSVKEMIGGQRLRVEGTQPAALPPAPTIAQSDNFLALFEDRSIEFQWALAAEPAAAQERFHAIRDVFCDADSRLIQARLPMLEALFEFGRGNYAAADSKFASAAEQLDALGLKPELWQALHLRARCQELLGHQENGTRLGEAAEALLTEIAGSLPGSDRAIFLLNKATVDEQFVLAQLEALVRDQQQAATGFGFASVRARMRLLRRLHGLLEHVDTYKEDLADRQLVRERVAPPASKARARRGSLLKRLLSIPRNRAVLSFLVLPDRLLTVWTGFMTFGFSVSPVTRLDLRERVRRWHELMHSAAAGPRRDLGAVDDQAVGANESASGAKLIADLGDALQLDTVLAALPKRVRALSIVPDDVLHGVPFAALMHDGKYLIERFALSIGFTTRTPAAARRADRRSALVVAVSQGLGLPPLAQVPQESRSVTSWLEKRGLDVSALVDGAANRGAILDRLGATAIAHIASHGTFEPDRPDRSGILLSLEERVTIRDLAQLRLEHCRHVTLSSCWSADNFILPGRWIISLPETLCRSGAESTLSALWAVDDEVAAAFMDRFYAELERRPRDAALRAVQLACLANELGRVRAQAGRLIDTRATFFWSGFTLCGNPGVLRL
jgi:tetratricopeptide (TPR) repeat protein